MKQIIFCILLFLITLATACFAGDTSKQPTSLPAIVGENRLTKTVGDETLMEVARREGVGYEILANSNRDLDPWNPGVDTTVILPGEILLPFASGPGLTINLAELRLFHIVRGGRGDKVSVYPLGIGRSGRETPEGTYRVIIKKEHPDWLVPEGLRELDPELPQIVPPGPQNPLGNYWLGLSAPGYGVHGTNRPFGVGRRVSYGCLRMYADDIATLYSKVTTGTPVQISYEPIKAAWDKGYLFLEVHPDYLERYGDSFQQALSVISRTGWPGEIDYERVKKVVHEQRSLPEIVGMLTTE